MVDEFTMFGTNPKFVSKLLVVCPEGRGNFRVDSENTGDAMVLSVPGASVASHNMESTIIKLLNAHNITEIVIMPHTDCYLSEPVDQALRLGRRIDPQIYSSFAEPFKHNGISFNDKEHLERVANPALQSEAMGQIIGDWQAIQGEHARSMRLTVKLWDARKETHNATTEPGKKILLVAKPSRWHYEHMLKAVSESLGRTVGMHGTYVLQPPDITSIKLLVMGPGIRDVVLYTAKSEERYEMRKLARDLKEKDFVIKNNVRVSIAEKKPFTVFGR